MSNKCEALVGYLLPRKSCENPSETKCSKCTVPICYQHAEIDAAGTLCPACMLPSSMRPSKKSTDLHLSEADLKSFAEAYRQQKSEHGGWIEFT